MTLIIYKRVGEAPNPRQPRQNPRGRSVPYLLSVFLGAGLKKINNFMGGAYADWLFLRWSNTYWLFFEVTSLKIWATPHPRQKLGGRPPKIGALPYPRQDRYLCKP